MSLAAGDAGLQVDHPGIGCGVAEHVQRVTPGARTSWPRDQAVSTFRRADAGPRVTGSFTRSVTLPEGADTEHITAGYDKGMLQVTVPVPQAKGQAAASRSAAPESGPQVTGVGGHSQRPLRARHSWGLSRRGAAGQVRASKPANGWSWCRRPMASASSGATDST